MTNTLRLDCSIFIVAACPLCDLWIYKRLIHARYVVFVGKRVIVIRSGDHTAGDCELAS